VTFLELKSLTVEQLSAVVKLDQLCLGGLWTEAGYQREIESPNSDLLVLVQSEVLAPFIPNHSIHPATDNAPTLIGVGCLWAILEEAHITLLGIHPDYQRQGLGQLLLAALLQNARLRGLEWATLEVRASNQAALSLYQKFGFQDVGRRKRYYKDTDEDALILWRSKIQSPEFAEILLHWQQQIRDRLTLHNWQLIEGDMPVEV